MLLTNAWVVVGGERVAEREEEGCLDGQAEEDVRTTHDCFAVVIMIGN